MNALLASAGVEDVARVRIHPPPMTTLSPGGVVSRRSGREEGDRRTGTRTRSRTTSAPPPAGIQGALRPWLARRPPPHARVSASGGARTASRAIPRPRGTPCPGRLAGSMHELLRGCASDRVGIRIRPEMVKLPAEASSFVLRCDDSPAYPITGASDRRGMHGASSWRESAVRPLPPAASTLHAGNPFSETWLNRKDRCGSRHPARFAHTPSQVAATSGLASSAAGLPCHRIRPLPST